MSIAESLRISIDLKGWCEVIRRYVVVLLDHQRSWHRCKYKLLNVLTVLYNIV